MCFDSITVGDEVNEVLENETDAVAGPAGDEASLLGSEVVEQVAASSVKVNFPIPH